MRLSAILRFGKKPYGHKYRGKHRVVKEIKLPELRMLREDYERTERNMLILRHPYLTVEQSNGHMTDKKQDKTDKFWEKIHKPRDERFSNHITLAERLIHLKVKETWD